MAALTTIALIAGAAIAAAGTGYEVSQSRDAAREGKDAARDQENAQKKLEADALQKRKTDELQAAANVQSAQKRMMQYQAGASTKGGTIKTSALGTTADDASYARKMALGV